MANELNFTIPVTELAEAIAEKLAPLFIGIKTQETPVKEVYCTSIETADQLLVSLLVLNELAKKNLITGYPFSVQVMHKTDTETAQKK